MRGQVLAYREIPLFEHINETDLGTLLSCLGCFERTYKKGEILIMDQEDVQYVGVVRRGAVHMLKEDIWGNKTLLAHIGRGELFGEIFAVQKEAMSYVTYVACTDVDVLFLPARKIIHSCPRSCAFHAQLTQNMFDLLGRKSVQLMEKIEVSSKPSLREKLLAYFSMLARKQGGRYITVPLNRTELAEYLGANRSAMVRQLAAMRTEGLIDYDKNTFILKKDPTADS